MDMTAVRDDILAATLPNVAFDGWSCRSLRDGAEAAGYDCDTTRRAFPGGVPDLVDHFAAWTDRRMIEALAAEPVATMRVRDRARLVVRTYFEVLEPHREAKRRLLAWLALPVNVGLGLRLLYRTVDTMWYAAGDDSTDFNHYTKRALLAAVVSSTTLYWLDDDSDGHADTWGFLDRRLADVMRVGKATARMRDARRLVAVLPSPVRFLRQMRHRAAAQAGASTHIAENI